MPMPMTMPMLAMPMPMAKKAHVDSKAKVTQASTKAKAAKGGPQESGAPSMRKWVRPTLLHEHMRSCGPLYVLEAMEYVQRCKKTCTNG